MISVFYTFNQPTESAYGILEVMSRPSKEDESSPFSNHWNEWNWKSTIGLFSINIDLNIIIHNVIQSAFNCFLKIPFLFTNYF